jgi:signal peptidase II
MAARVNRLQLVVLIVVLVAADQWTKQFARQYLSLHHRDYAGGLLSLMYAENEGAFLSMGSTLPPAVRTAVFSLGVLIAVGIALFVVFTGRVHGFDAVAVAMIGGGGIGNLIDRLTRGGRVTDFLFMELGPLHTGVFNVADMAITGGVIWLLVTSFLPKKDRDSPA